MTGISTSDVYSSIAQQVSSAVGSQGNVREKQGTESAQSTQSTSSSKRVTKGLGKTVGDVSLSEEGAEYYRKLKEKFKGMNFVLVSEDMKEQVKANAGAYGSANGMTVLVDVDKIEKMATDKEFREKYEGIISQAGNNLQKLSEGLNQSGGSSNGVVGFGAQINDNGTASYFAVIDKSLASQQKRIEEKQEAKRAEKKENEKAVAKERTEKRMEKKRAEKKEAAEKDEKIEPKTQNKNPMTLTADSVEELLKKVGDTMQNIRMDTIRTPMEQALGGSIDFRG